MLKNYLKISLRNLVKNKIFSFINIIGLSVGLACCILITLYLKFETSYDSFQANVNDIYEVGTVFLKTNGIGESEAHTSSPIAAAMKQEFPEVMESTRLLPLFAEDKTLLQHVPEGEHVKSLYESKGYLADASFFLIFTYNFIEGNAATALTQPNTVVLSEEIAKKLFSNESALNKTIHVSSNTNGEHDFLITGVFRPNAIPSHIDAKFFLSINGGDMENYIKTHATDFATNNMFFTYLQLKPGSDYKQLENKFPAFIEKYASADLKRMGFRKKQFLVPLKDVHLSAELGFNATPAASKTYLYILGSIAVFTLLIACINFMNLTTARSSKRSAEVGVRKVMGAIRADLIRQFMGESLIMTLVAFLLALAIAFLMLPLFNQVSGKNISFSIIENKEIIFTFLALALLTAFVAGSYPAFYLSSFIPVKVLKGKVANSLAVVSLRKGMVIFQFVISVVLIISSVVIFNQMNYLRKADLGFAKDQQLVIPLRSHNAKSIYPSFKNDLNAVPGIQSIGASMYYPGIFNPSDNVFYREGQTMNEAKRTRMNWVDYDFLQTLEITPVAGRLFSRQFPADTGYKIIVNAEAVKQIGFASPQEAIGQKIFFDWQGTTYPFEILGVVKDFHFEDLHVPITPYGFQLEHNNKVYNYAIIHAKTSDMKHLLTAIEARWHKLNPNEPFEYHFLDEDFQKNYDAESRLSAIVLYFTIIAILISCLGLFGLVAFSAEQRTREIGVRKVLGASVETIVALLSKDFLKLVLIAIIIASPIAWYVMNQWLQDFAYRTSISWWIFILTALIAILIAVLTLSIQTIKAALANPVRALRSE